MARVITKQMDFGDSIDVLSGQVLVAGEKLTVEFPDGHVIQAKVILEFETQDESCHNDVWTSKQVQAFAKLLVHGTTLKVRLAECSRLKVSRS